MSKIILQKKIVGYEVTFMEGQSTNNISVTFAGKACRFDRDSTGKIRHFGPPSVQHGIPSELWREINKEVRIIFADPTRTNIYLQRKPPIRNNSKPTRLKVIK